MKKFFLILLVCCLSLNGVAQTAESDKYYNEGVRLYNQKKYSDAIPYFEKSDSIDKATLDSTSNRRDYSAMWLASCYATLGEKSKADEIDPEHLFYSPIDRNLTTVSDSLSDRAVQLYADGFYQLALSKFMECAEIEKRIIGDKSVWYANSLMSLFYCYLALEDKGNALETGEEAYSIYTKHSFRNQYVADLYCSLGRLYYEETKYKQAITVTEQALSIYEELFGKENNDYAVILGDIALYNTEIGDYNKAVQLEEEVLQIQERVLGNEHPDYIVSLNNFAAYNSQNGNYSDAVKYGTKALTLQEKVTGKDDINYATSLNNLADYNATLGNFDEAIKMATEALQIREKILGKEHPDYAMSLNNLAIYNANLGNDTEAIKFGTAALNVYDSLYGKENPDYAMALDNLATYKADLGNFTEAIKLGTESSLIIEKTLGKVHPTYATALSHIASYNDCIGNYKEAKKIETQVLQIMQETVGNEHPKYAESLGKISLYNSEMVTLYDNTLKRYKG